MEKETRRFEINYSLDWEYGVEISKLKKDIEELEKLGATHIEIEASVSYDCACLTIEAKAERIETDEEFKNRVDAVNKRNEDIKRRDLEQLEMLKSKYGK
jgi:2-methylisocitrate lyase-like PEP mutase family enzyme